MIYPAALAVLVVFLIFAFNNRFLGREFYAARVGKLAAHWVGVLIQLVFIAVLTFLLLDWVRVMPPRSVLWTIGSGWAVLATAWELFAFHWVQRRRWSDVLAEYDPRAGQAWWLVTLGYLLAPVLMHDWLFAM